MIFDVDFKIQCSQCDKLFTHKNVYAYCDDCDEKNIRIDAVKESMKSVSDLSYEWEDKDFYTGFDSEEEKEAFMKGVKMGFSDSLFHIADYFGLITFYEDEIYNKFYAKKENKP